MHLILLVGLTLVSGLLDSRGFLHASRAWDEGQLVVDELLRSAGGFAGGILCYWLLVRSAQELGIVSAEAQTVAWFATTLVGVALVSGEYAGWSRPDQALGLIAVALILTLVVRTAT